MRLVNIAALGIWLELANAIFQGFNYGATKNDGQTIRFQSDFQSLFKMAKNLPGTSGFDSARLYTMVQGGTVSDPTSAIPAAIAENTSLLLGIWASAGNEETNNEIKALKAAIAQYGTAFTNLVAGISVGSEDLYRISPIGIEAKSGYGAEPLTIVNYINQVRATISGTTLSSAPIGHVDTWTAWVNGSNQAVIDASDWIGMDAYPYFQNTQANGIENGASLFKQAFANTKNAVNGKPIWITETGWPVAGSKSGNAETGLVNAKTYWDQVGCPSFGTVNTWWFTLDETDTSISVDPSFGIASGAKPLFDLSCSQGDKGPASSIANATASSVAGPVASSGAALSPLIGNGIRNTTGSGAAPTGLLSTNSSMAPSGTISGHPAGATATATPNSASLSSRSILDGLGALVVALLL